MPLFACPALTSVPLQAVATALCDGCAQRRAKTANYARAPFHNGSAAAFSLEGESQFDCQVFASKTEDLECSLRLQAVRNLCRKGATKFGVE